MKAIPFAATVVLMAGLAYADPPVYPGEIPSYKKSVDPAGGFVYDPVDGQWHANSLAYPFYCAIPSGESGGAVTQGSPPWTFEQVDAVGNTAPAGDTAARAGFAQLSDGSAPYTGAKTGQLPAALGAGGGLKVDGSGTDLPVTIEYDADDVLSSFYEAVSTGRGTYQPTLGGSAPYDKCTACNLGTANPVCIRGKTGITRGKVVSARAAATSPPDCVGFRNVSTLEIDTSTTGCSGGSTVEITCEQ